MPTSALIHGQKSVCRADVGIGPYGVRSILMCRMIVIYSFLQAAPSLTVTQSLPKVILAKPPLRPKLFLPMG